MTAPHPIGSGASSPGSQASGKPGSAGATGASGHVDPAADPSMEDILASIRRILSEDESKAPPGGFAATSEKSGLPSDDVFILEPSMLVEEPATPAPANPPGRPTAVSPPAASPPAAPAATAPPYFAPEPPVPVQTPSVSTTAPLSVEPAAAVPSQMHGIPAEPPRSDMAAGDLVAPAAAAAAATSVGSLLKHLQQERQTAVYRGGPTIEDVVREEMRPILKQWLDAHLPSLVERLVRAEIERVVARSVS
jgi:cell pole-organizing protein PopZ